MLVTQVNYIDNEPNKSSQMAVKKAKTHGFERIYTPIGYHEKTDENSWAWRPLPRPRFRPQCSAPSRAARTIQEASGNEIPYQIAQLAVVMGELLKKSKHTNRIIRQLMEGVELTADAAGIVSRIAGYVDLLAQYETSDAIHGVVGLSTQTVMATAEIGREIGRIQATTKAAAQALQGISNMIDEVGKIAAALAAATARS